ncbi:MAG: flavin reductase [Gammaproteobacteria bacterium]|nr:flavin reductase [Gammaproteobacteria bacterium]
MDPKEFRNALGQFATGVTVITTTDEERAPVGVTASSFNSVSLDPPLVLWSLAKNSGSLTAYQNSGHFCVHVLASDHQDLSQRFAARGTDKFAGLQWQAGEGGVPLLPDFAAQFQCKTTYQYEGGDHVIFVGEVLQYETRDEKPLVFHAGSYATAKAKAQGEPAGQAVDVTQGKFSNNFFLYLLSRAHFQASADLNRHLQDELLNQSDYLTVTLLGLSGPLSYQDLSERLQHTGHVPSPGTIKILQDRSLITETPDGAQFALTVKGRELHVKLLAVSKATEERLLANFADDEVAEARAFLQRFIEQSDPGVPPLWAAEESK